MGSGLLAAVSVAYLGVALQYIAQGRYGIAVVFVGYAVANCGFIWDLHR